MAETPEFSAATAADCLQLIKMSLLEDVGATNIIDGVDCTTDAIVPQGTTAQAAFVSRGDGIVCGVETCNLAIEHFAEHLALASRSCRRPADRTAADDRDHERPGS